VLHFYTVLIAKNTFTVLNFFAMKCIKINASVYKNASASGDLPLPRLLPWTSVLQTPLASPPPNRCILATPLVMIHHIWCAVCVEAKWGFFEHLLCCWWLFSRPY